MKGVILILLLFLGAAISLFFVMISMPGNSFSGIPSPFKGRDRDLPQALREHVIALSNKIGPRSVSAYEGLRRAERYIEESFSSYGYQVERQVFTVGENHLEVANLAVELPGTERSAGVIIVGAHYDTFFDLTPGADDNASAVAALLEMSRRLKDNTPPHTLRFVAFTNEEPPYFWSSEMGSRQYAKLTRQRGDKIIGMISLEMLGYYSDEPNSQHYPFPFSLFYPHKGDFIAFVGNLRSRAFARSTIAAFRVAAQIPSEGLAAPGFLPGISLSDHSSFWWEGYPALMVTDTAFYRNPHYHLPSDTHDTLDYKRMARVVIALEAALMAY